ncbi:MAG: transporter [Rhizorhabdus sp.]|nr:transporter [Rhizorhabdus sp.]
MMNDSAADTGAGIGESQRSGAFAPLAEPLFRRIWFASLFSNFGQLIQGVGAAWAMTQMTGRADMVALVQTATMAPLMLGAIPAGAIADMYDRRRIAMFALAICLCGASALTLLCVADLLTPSILLMFCFIVGIGTALFAPAWQASVGEQVKQKDLAAAVALNSISYNIARSFGPAIGGVLVAVAGVVSAFSFNTVAYVPLLLVMFLWQRKPERSRLPPEGLGRAIISGVRFIFHSPPIRTVCLRTMIIALAGSSVAALMPLVARVLLHGDASTYGLMLGSFGVGAVAGAMGISGLRARLSHENILGASALLMGVTMIGVGLSHSMILSSMMLVGGGAAWMISIAVCNISVQLSAPRWVTGRALAGFQASVTGGLAIGGWAWGSVAAHHGTDVALMISGAAMIATIAARFFLRAPALDDSADHSTPEVPDPEKKLKLTGRSGPIVITIEYRVDKAQARTFYGAMQQVQLIRQRTGAYGWSIARDISDPEIWTERYHTPTWHDYLRQRSRVTEAELAITARASAFHKGDQPPKIRRKLERPFGSVRWTDESPDARTDIISPVPQAGVGG